MLMSRGFRSSLAASLLAAGALIAGCSSDTPTDTAVLNPSAPKSLVIPSPEIVAGSDAGQFGNLITPIEATRDFGAFWDNKSSDGSVGQKCNAGFFAVGTIDATCENQIGAPASYNNRGGFAGGTYWGKTADGTKPASFKFNGAFEYTVTQLGGWRGGNSEVGYFTVENGSRVFHPIPSWGNGTGQNVAIIVPAGADWGFYVRNNFNPQVGGCGDADTDCSDATGDWNDPPPARQQFALFRNSANDKFLVAAEDNQLILLPNGANLDSDYNDYFWSVTRNVVAPSLDLTITKTGPSNANIGQQVMYTVQGFNNSSVDASNVVVVDTLPLGATYVSSSNGGTTSTIPAGNTVVTWPTIPTLAANTSTPAYTVTVTYAAVGSYTNNTHINTSTTETNYTNNHADKTTVVTQVPQTDLTITKTGAATANVGEQVVYTVTGQNLTAVTALNVTIQDTLPAGATFVSASNGGTHVNGVVTWNVGTLLGNSSTIGYTVTVTYAAPGSYKDNAHIFTTTTETNYDNNHADATTVVPPPACVAAQVPGLGSLSNLLFLFSDGSTDANWQGATKGFSGNVAVDDGAKFRTSGGVPYAGTIMTNGSTLGAWQKIVDQNAGQAFASLNNPTVVTYENNLNASFAAINAMTVTAGFDNRSAASLDGLNTQDGIAKTYVINVTSGFQVSSKLDITGDAGDLFILRWDTDKNAANGYQGQVKFQSGGGIVPHGGLTPANFVHVAGDINSSGGGSNPPLPYPQGPGVIGGQNWNGGGFFTGYWLTTGDPVKHETSSLSNGIFVGGWYTITTKFSMTSGTSGIHVGCP